MTHRTAIFVFLGIGLLGCFLLSLISGAVSIPASSVFGILLGDDSMDGVWRYIILQYRLPQALTAVLSGGALSLCGLLLQAIFKNPLADPSILGVSSGAGLGVACVMLLFGGGLTMGSLSAFGVIAVLSAALLGALTITLIMFVLSNMIRSNALLLIAGIMVGYLSSSVIVLLNFFAADDGIRNYVSWGMGSFSGVTMNNMPLFSVVLVACAVVASFYVKSLNVAVLGDNYAHNLGIGVRALRNTVLLTTGVMTALVTAFCGPISFLGLAVPHISRLLFRTDDYRILFPATILVGSDVTLMCNLFCTMPPNGTIVPINAVTPIIGVPIILYVMLRKKIHYER